MSGQSKTALLWTANCKYAKPAWVTQPNCHSGRRTSLADKLMRMEQQLLQLYKPLTTTGLMTMSVGKLDQEAVDKGWSTWFSVHCLKAVDSKGASYYSTS